MARRFVSRPRGRGSKKPTAWITTIENAVTDDPGTNFVELVSGTGIGYSTGVFFPGGVQTTDFTVLRTRGVWKVAPQTELDAGDAFQVSMGVGVVTEQAAALGGVPAPGQNSDWDGWFIHRTYELIGQGNGGGTSVNPEAVINQLEIDSKGMRKIETGDVLFTAFQIYNLNAVVAPVTISSSFFARFLLKIN